MKRFLCAALFYGLVFSLWAVPQTWTAGGSPLRITGWEMKETERSQGPLTEIELSGGLTPYQGAFLEHDEGIENSRYTFQAEIMLPPTAKDKPLAILLGPSDYPNDLYVNGVQLAKTGEYIDRYNSTIYYSSRVYLPPSLLVYGAETNRIRVESFPAYETSPLADVYIGSYADITRMVFFRNLFNVNLVQAVVVVALIIAIFFAFMFFRSPNKDQRYLFCMLLSLSFALGYLNMSLFHDAADDVLLDKLSRTGLAATSLNLCFFAISYVGVFSTVRWLKPVLALPCFVSIVGNWLQTDKRGLAAFFSSFTSNFVLMPFLLLTGFVLVIGLIRKFESGRVVILIGFVAAVAASVHDLYYVTIHITPYCYVVAYGYLALLVSIFFVSALEQGTIARELGSRTRRLDERNQTLGELVAELTTVSEGLVKASTSMSTTISQTLGAVTAFGDENKRICDAMGEQIGRVEAELVSIRKTMAISSHRIPEALENQSGAVAAVERALERMKAAIAENLDSAEASNAVAGSLASEADSGSKVLVASKKAIGEVVEHTKSLQGILAAIDDIVSRTHVLSINAAIESARLGAAGKGFAVVAQEIRGLSDQSQRSLGSSFGTIKDMAEAVDKGADLSDRAAASLMAIAAKSVESAAKASAMRERMVALRTDGEGIVESAGELTRQTELLRRLAQEQREANETSQADFQALHDTLDCLAKQLTEQDKRKKSLYFALDMLKEVAEANDRHIADLRASLHKARDADVQEMIPDMLGV